MAKPEKAISALTAGLASSGDSRVMIGLCGSVQK